MGTALEDGFSATPHLFTMCNLTIRRIQLSGPMSGIQNYNRPEFDAIYEELTGYGFDVWTPSSLNETNTTPWNWQTAVKRCIREMLDRDALIMLPDWVSSRGARLEHFVAESLGIPCYEWVSFKRHLAKMEKGT